MDYLERCYQKNPDIVYRKIADEMVLVPIRHNVADMQSIFNLNAVGKRIWELLDGKTRLKEIKEILITEFDITAQTLEKDLIEFIQQLESIEAIKVNEG